MDYKKLEATKEEIRERYPEIKFPDVKTVPLFYGRKTMNRFENRNAIVGVFDDEEFPYTTATDQYKVVTHEEALMMLEKGLKELAVKHPEFGVPNIRPTMLESNGNPCAKMMTRVAFPDVPIDKKEVKVGDLLEPEVRMFNSYDLGWDYGLGGWAKRLSCTNGCFSTEMFTNVRKKHRLNLDVPAIVAQLTYGLGQYSKQINLWKKWSKTTLPEAEFDNLFEKLPFGETHREEIKALPEATTKETINDWVLTGSVNVWNLHNIVTQFLTHKVASEFVRMDKTMKVGRLFRKLYH